MNTRDEHIAWAKKRAREYLDSGNLADAVASMGSDLNKHPETRPARVILALGTLYVVNGDLLGVQRWIDSFL